MRIPTRRSELAARRKKKLDLHLTPTTIERLKKELKDLERKKLPEAAEEVKRTGAFGDFSENAEYQYAKTVLRRINDRILLLKTRINHAIPIQRKASEAGRATIGATVVLQQGQRQVTYEIVGAEETDPARGRISHLSPLGAALLNHRAGDEVTITMQDNRTTTYKILEVT